MINTHTLKAYDGRHGPPIHPKTNKGNNDEDKGKKRREHGEQEKGSTVSPCGHERWRNTRCTTKTTTVEAKIDDVEEDDGGRHTSAQQGHGNA